MKKDIRNTFLFKTSWKPTKKELTDAQLPVLPKLDTNISTATKRAVWYDSKGDFIGHSSYYAARKFCFEQINKKVKYPYDSKERIFAGRLKFTDGWVIEDRKTCKYFYYIIEH